MRASSASSITGMWDDGAVQLARVIGTVVATQKHRKFEGAKLLLVQPVNLDDTPRGPSLLAVDAARIARAPRPHEPSPEELAAHLAMLRTITQPLWLAES